MLEGRHVIGLFLLMLLFSGVFFTLGYVMGRNQVDAQLRNATDLHGKPINPILPKPEPAAKRGSTGPASDAPTDTTAAPNSDWEFYHAGDSKKPEARLKPLPPTPASAPAKSEPVLVKTTPSPRAAGAPPKNAAAPLIAGGGYTLQVAALTKEADAIDLATRLQKKKFPAFVLSPQTDKYYRVQVGPYADPKAAEVAWKGLEGAGFKAIVKH